MGWFGAGERVERLASAARRLSARLDRACPLAGDRRGIAALELGLVLPFVMLLILGVVEVSGHTLLHDKLDAASMRVGDLATRDETITTAELNELFGSVKHLANPADFDDRGVVIISAISTDASARATIAWQRRGGGDLTKASRIGLAGAAPTLPPELSVAANETIIAVELFYSYGGSSAGFVPSRLIYKAAFHQGRKGGLGSIS